MIKLTAKFSVVYSSLLHAIRACVYTY